MISPNKILPVQICLITKIGRAPYKRQTTVFKIPPKIHRRFHRIRRGLQQSQTHGYCLHFAKGTSVVHGTRTPSVIVWLSEKTQSLLRVSFQELALQRQKARLLQCLAVRFRPIASLARAGNVHRLAVFGHRAAGDLDAVGGELFDEVLFAIGARLVFVVNDFSQLEFHRFSARSASAYNSNLSLPRSKSAVLCGLCRHPKE